MTTFSILFKCLPFFFCVGLGINALFTGLFPSWRENWRHWSFYDTDEPIMPNSWLVALGWAKTTKPVAEGDFEEKTAIRVQVGLGLLLLTIGIAGIVWIVLQAIGN